MPLGSGVYSDCGHWRSLHASHAIEALSQLVSKMLQRKTSAGTLRNEPGDRTHARDRPIDLSIDSHLTYPSLPPICLGHLASWHSRWNYSAELQLFTPSFEPPTRKSPRNINQRSGKHRKTRNVLHDRRWGSKCSVELRMADNDNVGAQNSAD